MSDAQTRGWGRGWPTNRSVEMVDVRIPSGGVLPVHRRIAPIINYIVQEIERRGYRIGKVRDDWGYANRPIRGTRTPSNHSWGLAVDIDATAYPQGQRTRRPSQWMVDLFRHWGFDWGGTWGHADPMHFEFDGTPQRADQLVAMLAASHVGGVPVPVPVGTPPVVKPAPPFQPVASKEKPMQIVHCPDNPAQINPDTWLGTDGMTYRDLAPGEPDWLVISGLVPTPNRGPDGSVRPVPMPWRYLSRLRKV